MIGHGSQDDQVGRNLHAPLQAWMVVFLLWHFDVAGPLSEGNGRVHANGASPQIEILIHVACEARTSNLKVDLDKKLVKIPLVLSYPALLHLYSLQY
jgi:hypothetical protein